MEQGDDQIFVGEERKRTAPKQRDGGSAQVSEKIFIVGGGAADLAAAENYGANTIKAASHRRTGFRSADAPA